MTKGLGVVLTGFLAVACGGGDGDGGASDAAQPDAANGPSNTVGGTVTLPEAVTERCAMVAVDSDTTGSNGPAQRGDGTYLLSYHLVTGTTVDFSFDRVPADSYFVWAYVDTDASASDPLGDCEIMDAPSSGDHFGYHDTGLAPPGAPNVPVPHAEDATFDFSLDVYP